jgi:hypothetical protein
VNGTYTKYHTVLHLQVSASLNLSIFVTRVKLQVSDVGSVKLLLSWPLESIAPGLVTEPLELFVSMVRDLRK